MRTKSKIIFALMLYFVIPNVNAGLETKYLNVSRANIREEPGSTAKIVATWPINSPIFLLKKINNDWCQIANQDQSISGYAQCVYLSDKALTTSKIELDMANTVLALNRFKLTKQDEDEFSLLEQLFQQLERHFYISPSLHTYQLYNQTISYVLNTYNNKDKFSPELNQLVKTKITQTKTMQQSLSFNPKTTGYTPITRPITSTLKSALENRQGLQSFSTTKPSYFKNNQWVIGWEGGRFLSDKLNKAGDGVTYKIGFDGYNVAVLGGVVEMAKQHKAIVTTTFRSSKNGDDGLTQMQKNMNSEYEFATVTVTLPAYAITDNGVVQGVFKRASFAGDACWGEEGNTYAEFVFPKPLGGITHGFFISSSAINTANAKVTVTKKTTHNIDTLTHAISTQVDIDNDGIADLRTIISTDAEVARANPSPFLAGLLPKLKPKMMPVGGWYAHDIYSLEANQNGLWETLSIYNVVTCT